MSDPPSSPRSRWDMRPNAFITALLGVIVVSSGLFLGWAHQIWHRSYTTFAPLADSIHQSQGAATQALLLQIREGSQRRDSQELSGATLSLLEKSALHLKDAIEGKTTLEGRQSTPPPDSLLEDLKAYQDALAQFDQTIRAVVRQDTLDQNTRLSLLQQYYEADRLANHLSDQLLANLAHDVETRRHELEVALALWSLFLVTAVTLALRAHRIQNALNHQQDMIRALLETTTDGVFVRDTEGRYLMVNETVATMIGRTSADMLGRTDEEVVSPEVLTQIRHSDEVVFAAGRVCSFETALSRPDGTERILWTTKGPIHDNRGRLAGVFGIARDITERKMAERQMRDREAQLQGIIENLNEGLILFSPAGEFLSWNRAAMVMHGFTGQRAPQGSLAQFHEHYELTDADGVLLEFSQWPIMRVLRGENLRDFEITSRRRDGLWEKTFSCGGCLVSDPDGLPIIGILSLSDITERKKAENALRTSEKRFQLFMDNSPTVAWIKDLSGRHLYLSRRFTQRTGKGPADWLGQTNKDLFPPDVAEALSASDQMVVELRRPIEVDERTPNPDGTFSDWRTIKFPFQDASNAWFIGAIALDVTERRRAEAELERHRQHLEALVSERTRELIAAEAQARLLLDSTADGLCGIAPDGSVTFINPIACEMLALTPAQALGQSIHALIHSPPGNGAPCQPENCALLADLRAGVAVENREDVFWTSDGRPIPVLCASHPIRDGAVLSGAVLSFMDISPLKAMEDSLQRTRTVLQNVLDTLPATVGYWNTDLTNRFANHAYLTWFGIDPATIPGRHMREVIGEKRFQRKEPYVKGVLRGVAQTFEQVFSSPDGSSVRYARQSLIPDMMNGEVRGFLSVIDDITSIKEAERLADAARVEAERLAQVRSEFLANMSHEIRTPMNVILGFASLLDRAPLGASEHELVRKLRRAGQSLMTILNDILDFSRIEAGRVAIENVPFLLNDVLEHVATVMASAAENKPIELLVGPAPPDVQGLEGDALRVEQVLTNLVCNALKFTEHGFVSLTVACLENTSSRVHLRFMVSDSGIGIAPDKQQAIFSAFEQADSSTTRRYGGSGLGLSICKRLVDLMGGTIAVESTPGRGSTFIVDLPFNTCDQPDAFVSLLGHRHLLIADDHADARAVLSATALNLGWTAEPVASGEEAVTRALTRAHEGTPFDVLLLDWQMPGLDGLKAGKAIRTALEQETAGQKPLIVMISAYSRDDLKRHPDADVADVILTKPVTASALADAVHAAENRRDKTQLRLPVPAPKGTPRLSGKRVLVVDDSEINLEMAELILSNEGATVCVASHGQEALDLLRATNAPFDVVLMDVQMPDMDGCETTRRLRAMPGLETIPVIAVSAGALKSEREAALAVGMSGFVAKPFEIDELINAVRDASPLDTPSLPPPPPPPPPADPRRLPVLDPRRGRGVWGDTARYHKALRRFAQDYDGAGERLRDAVDAGDKTTAGTLAHKLKGAAGALALARVEGLAGALARWAREEGSPTAPVDDLTRALATALDDSLMAITHETGLPTSLPQGPLTTDIPAALPTLEALLNALDRDRPGEAEPILGALATLVPAELLAPARERIDAFDFRAAEALIRSLRDWLRDSAVAPAASPTDTRTDGE
ncbi:PAS domain S-box protein [Pararhodospirillum oryzae]|uniref:histidine kinase n=1 Tax=Pararhodospirillum oryzae TaxID=478448 RepID=A0A512H4D4_9PROT|nr:PAS domain S-box protein [Pararhodospirillum oryzae]GEO80291.1 hypothetical protein ROR02_04220 [Pararhodospirillum oryzae]